ncbi:MAG: riboflavin kinase/FMN adenylyltransferase [Granulosicoccus sp.]|jgi:riboflavin kinase/FMN adenylyltransferase
MYLIRSLNRWPDEHETVVTMGNFDGAHLGHQAMFSTLKAAALKHQLPATVVSFDPLPHEYFSQNRPPHQALDDSPKRLQGFRDRFLSIQHAGMDRMLLLRFDNEFAEQSAEDFITHTLVDRLHARHLVIGDDFRFGHQRQGTFELLEKASKKYGFTLEQCSTCEHDGERISSTCIRQHLSDGQLDAAASLLGRPYRISGRVIHGEKVGRQLGFPTANVALGDHRPPLLGVFAVMANNVETGQSVPAVANLGERPTIGGRKLLLEVHALDRSVHWYGHHLSVDFVAQLRKEIRFASLDELKAQIAKDADAARQLMNGCR